MTADNLQLYKGLALFLSMSSCIILGILCSLLRMSVFYVWSLSLDNILLICARILVLWLLLHTTRRLGVMVLGTEIKRFNWVTVLEICILQKNKGISFILSNNVLHYMSYFDWLFRVDHRGHFKLHPGEHFIV